MPYPPSLLRSARLIAALLAVTVLGAAETRPFRLGFTTWPSDTTPAAVEAAYRTIATDGDLICHHLDNGVPWVEAAAGQPFGAALQADWAWRTGHAPAGHQVLLALSALNMGRNALSGWWSSSENQPLPPGWAERAFDDPLVVSAYTAYALAAVERFRPTWLAIGIEVNLLMTNRPDRWSAYLSLHRQVYAAVKRRHPKLPVMATFLASASLAGWRGEDSPPAQAQALADLLPYCDVVAFSIYPHLTRYFAGDAPKDWYDRLAALAGGKPVAISECGFPAQPFTMGGLTFAGSPDTQTAFVRQLLEGALRHRSPFVVWFTARDYDPLWAKLPPTMRDLGLLWRDTGLLDHDGTARPALAYWRAARAARFAAPAGNPPRRTD